MSQTRIDRRRWPRIAASSLGDLSAAIASNPDAKLVNLSRGGALFEVAGRCPIGTSLRVKLDRPDCDTIIAVGDVAWGNVMSITDGRIKYRVAVAFEQVIPEVAVLIAMDQQQPTGEELPSVASVAENRTLTKLATAAGPSGNNRSIAAAASAEKRHVPTDDRIAHLQKQLDERTGDLLSVSLLLESLTERLRTCDGFRAALQDRLETERRQREDERSTHVCQVADAIARAETLQATLDACQQEHAESLRERDARHEVIVADLIMTSNEQQQEYHRLLDQSIAAEDEQRRRAEQYEQELAQRDVQLQEQRAEADARGCELDARLEAAERLRAAYDKQYKALQRQAEKLMMMFSAPSDSEDSLRDEPAAEPEEEEHVAEGVR